jgi:hypothetical protein
MPEEIRIKGKEKYIETGENKNRKREVKEELKEEKWLEGRGDEIVNIVATTRWIKCIYISTALFCASRIHDIVPFTLRNPQYCSFHI